MLTVDKKQDEKQIPQCQIWTLSEDKQHLWPSLWEFLQSNTVMLLLCLQIETCCVFLLMTLGEIFPVEIFLLKKTY